MTTQRLPATLPCASTGIPVDLRSSRGPIVIVMIHPTTCIGCRAYLEELADHAGAVAEWGGRVLIVVRGALHPALDTSFRILGDPENKLDADAPALIVADEWGEIYFKADGCAEHALPNPEEIVEWARFIAIQCPECEQPEGEWRTF